VCRRGGRADARPLLKSLHWLPLNQHITYILPAKSLHSLRSVDSFRLQVQRTCTSLAGGPSPLQLQHYGTLYQISWDKAVRCRFLKSTQNRYYSVPHSRDRRWTDAADAGIYTHTYIVGWHAGQSGQNVAGMKRRNSYIQNVIGHTAVTTRFQDSRTVMQEKFVPPRTSMATYFMTKVLLM